jgi:outer membrane protein
MNARRLLFLLLACDLSISTTAAGEAPARTLTVDEAIAFALAHHPRIRTAQAGEEAGDARVDEAEARKLPDLGLSAQLNRSTGNTVPGAFFSQSGFVPIAGPTRGRAFDGGTWQTGGSVWATWDVLSLVRQAAAVDIALATKREAEVATSARRFEIAYAVADAYVDVVAAEETVKATRAYVERTQVFAGIVKTLVGQELRPGADGARVDAEIALAQTDLARAQQGEDVRRAQLAEAMGAASERVSIVVGGLLGPVDDVRTPSVPALAQHPLVVEAASAIDRTREQKRAVALEYLPRLDLVASLWLRGSGYFGSPGDGLAPDIPNWAAGAVATWAFSDLPRVRARQRAAAASEAAAASRRDETTLAVESQWRTSVAVLNGAIKVAHNTPAALASARAAETQASARYKAGLASELEVADAQRLLVRAEVDDALARLDVRRALLLVARASGDLGPFLAVARGGR